MVSRSGISILYDVPILCVFDTNTPQGLVRIYSHRHSLRFGRDIFLYNGLRTYDRTHLASHFYFLLRRFLCGGCLIFHYKDAIYSFTAKYGKVFGPIVVLGLLAYLCFYTYDNEPRQLGHDIAFVGAFAYSLHRPRLEMDEL